MLTSASRTPLLWFIIMLSFTLNGCALFKQKPQADTSIDSSILHDRHMVLVNNIKQFSIKGRLGVMTNPKGFSGRVSWQHTTENDHIDIFSPLGGKVAYITKTPQDVALTNNKGEQVSAEDAETLTEKTLGFRLPLSGLSHWALGKPSNTGLVNYVTWDQNGRINRIQQNGWDITYKDYSMQEGYFLPKKVTLRTDTLIIKLIAEKWSDIKTR
ncbi:MAG: outer membrane lipoprotein LolB [Methylophilaceae bacterium]|jgi:outer membrane lipoprotein LolB